MVASFAVRWQGVVSVSVVLRQGVIIIVRGVVIVIRCGHHRTWVGRHRRGGRSFCIAFAGGAQSSFVGAGSSFVGPVVVDVGCHLVVWVVAVRGWVMVIVDGGWCLQVVVVRG